MGEIHSLNSVFYSSIYSRIWQQRELLERDTNKNWKAESGAHIVYIYFVFESCEGDFRKEYARKRTTLV
jgi:hypothetical protein